MTKPIKPLLDSENLPKRQGRYKRIIVELSRNGTSGTVIARCQGDCGGAYARIKVSEWRSESCRQSCPECAAASRISRTETSSG